MTLMWVDLFLRNSVAFNNSPLNSSWRLGECLPWFEQ